MEPTENEQSPTPETSAEEPVKNINVQPALFTIKNTVRSPHTKLQRKQSSGPNNLKQYLGAGELRIIRGAGSRVTEGTMLRHLKEIVQKVERGELQVLAPNGKVIALADLKRGLEYSARPGEIPLPQNPVPAPLPNFPLDSVKNDKPAGAPMPQFPGGTTAVVDPNARPDLLMNAPHEPPPPPPPETKPEGQLAGGGETKPEEGEKRPTEEEAKDAARADENRTPPPPDSPEHSMEGAEGSDEGEEEEPGGDVPALMGGTPPQGGKKKKKNR